MFMHVCMYVGNLYTPALIIQILNASSNTNIAEVTMIGKAISVYILHEYIICMYCISFGTLMVVVTAVSLC